MPKDLSLFQKDELPFEMKFYTMMDLLITNQVESRAESFIFMGLFYLQIISSFFAKQIKVLDLNHSTSDKILNYIERIVRLKDLFIDNYTGYKILLFVLFVVIVILIIHFFLSCMKINRASFYSFNEIFSNYYIKAFIFLLYNIILDLCFSIFCFGSDKHNPNFQDVSCSVKDNLPVVIISILMIIICLVVNIFTQLFYCDSFYLSNSYYAKMTCNYDFYWSLNNLVNSALLIQAKYLSREIFLVYHLFISIAFFIYYINHYLYYDKITNLFAGFFHTIYAWSSIFFLIFAYVDFEEKGVIYLLTCFIACCFYYSYKNQIEGTIFLDTPFYKIKNKFYLLCYLKNLIDKINKVEENPKDKAFLAGIIQMHSVECPNQYCLLKSNEPIYLPIATKWSDRSKRQIDDDVFLKNFLIIIMSYFISAHECNVDMFLNLSLYYLKIIGNYCQSIYFYKKVTEMKLSLQEKFSFVRLSIQLSKALVEKLKPSHEQCVSLEHLDVSMYYKYDALSQNFVDEISKDVTLSLEFWKTFRGTLKDPNKTIDFNKIFELTDKIRITKRNVETMWSQLLKIYGGANEFFDLYIEYIEQINDDDLKKRELEGLKRKNEGMSDHITSNYYSVLFNRNTGIIIANGDKGSEGIIEMCNGEIENIFKFKPSDIKGMNLTHLMPRLFGKDHSKYMERYFQVGEKKLIDKTDFKTFGKDKNNSVIKVKLALKLFPILNDNVFFVGLILKENLDDMILMDSKFNIQGMSTKLMKILKIDNKLLFQENEIPFYVICKKFVNFYNIFLQGKKKGDILGGSDKTPGMPNDIGNNIDNENNNNKMDKEKKKMKKLKKSIKEEIHENIEINENVELEYEIKLPQFLIEYSEKTDKKDSKLGMKLVSMASETVNDIDESLEEDYNEMDLLIDDSKEKQESERVKQSLNNEVLGTNGTLKPGENEGGDGQTPTPTPTPGGEATPGRIDNLDQTVGSKNAQYTNNAKSISFNKQSDEEKMYKARIRQYRVLFENGKFDELEDFIDSCNKDSDSNEFKFNFTFDRYKYGNKQISYIVRCIDNKSDARGSDEETIGEYDQKAAKYKKEKAESIKPLFEILEDEKKELLGLQDIFYKLSLENKKFQKLLQSSKNDIMNMSMAHGKKKDEILEDENSSQSSQVGFDSGLVKKNRIEEIRSNLLLNISNFYTLKYIKLDIILLALCTFIFCVLYIIVFWNLYDTLVDVSSVNVNLFQTSLWTTELVSIFLSLRTLFLKNTIETRKYNFTNYAYKNMSTNLEYYIEMESVVNKLYDNISKAYGILEMDIPKYLPENDLMTKYWDRINVTYVNDTEIYGIKDDESFPMSIAQILSSSISYVSDPVFNISDEAIENFKNLDNETRQMKLIYFNYSTFIIIENSYDNMLQNQFQKLLTIPTILSNYNKDRKKSIITIIAIYGGIMILLCVAYYFLVRLTNKSMTDGLEKVTKIRLDKIEETLKKIQAFNSNLKRFRDKDAKASEDNKETSSLSDDQNNPNLQAVNHTAAGPVKLEKKSSVNANNAASIVGSNGFNTDNKKYIPLNVLGYSFLHMVFVFAILCGFLIPIFISSNDMVYNTNQLILVQNHIFGELIRSSASTVEVKCFMSDCKNSTILKYSDIVNMDLIQDVIKGIGTFGEVSNFYNNKFLLNACDAAYDIEKQALEYNLCLNETFIESANNTDNLIKLIEDLVDNIYKEDIMNQNSADYFKLQLFNTSYFQKMEEIFYRYIIPVGDNFASLVNNDLNNYLTDKKTLVLILVCILGSIMIIYCLIFGVIFINQLIHYLSVSRCIMKIIPTTVIIATQDLETWIENKY